MNCREIRRRLVIYRELEADERAQVEAHLAHCRDCEAALARYQAQDEALSGLRELTPHTPPGELLAAARPQPAPRARPRWGYALALAAVLFLAGFGVTARVSADALPGDPLYAVKRAMEMVRQTVTIRERARLALDEELAARRLAEARQVQQQHRNAELDFEGQVQAVNAHTWRVSGLDVDVQRADWQGEAPLGQTVRVQARAVDGALEALQLQLAVRQRVGYPGPGYPPPSWAPGHAYPGPWQTGVGEAGPDENVGNASAGNELPGNESSGNASPGPDAPGNQMPGNSTAGNPEPGNVDEGNLQPGNQAPANPAPGNPYPGPDAPGNVSPANRAPGNDDPGASPSGGGRR